jgi:hypothetical protein
LISACTWARDHPKKCTTHVCEPRFLPKVRTCTTENASSAWWTNDTALPPCEPTLPAHLEIPPADLLVLLRRFGIAQLARRVVRVEQVIDNGAGLAAKGDSSSTMRSCFPRLFGADFEHTSHTVMPVFGSSRAGTRPLGLTLTKGSCFRVLKSIISCSYGMASSSRKMAHFQGLGP